MRRAWIFGLAMAALVAGAVPPAQGQGPVLVRDIATGPTYSRGSSPSPPVRFRGEDYFGADDEFLGYELWATLSAAGGRVYFTAMVGEGERELGVTDGTIDGTRVLDLAHPAASSAPHQLITSPGGLVLLASVDDTGSDLWRSGGHPEGTGPLRVAGCPGKNPFPRSVASPVAPTGLLAREKAG